MIDNPSTTETSPAALLPQFQVVGAELRAAGLIASHGGNLSVWIPDGVIITREGAMLGRLSTADLCLIGRTTQATPVVPALDTPIHRTVYVLAGGHAIVHAHPAYAVALSLACDELIPLDNDGRHLLQRVSVLPHARDIPTGVGEALATHPVVLVRGHGCYARGATLEEALQYTTQLEESARLLYLARSLELLPAERPGNG